MNDAAIAEYDGKGGMFKLYHLGVFATGSKDTVFSVHEYNFNPQNPLFQLVTGYKLTFNTLAKTSIDIKNFYNFRLIEKGILPLIFNDSVPLIIENGKGNEESLREFKKAREYDHEKYLSFIKVVEDTITSINKVILKRDTRKVIVLTKAMENSYINPHSGLNEVNKIFDITQDNILLGNLHKKVTGGNFGLANYTFWKLITPLTVNGIELKASPVAMVTIKACEMFPIEMIIVSGKKIHKLTPGPYNQMENPLVNLLVGNGAL